MLRPGANQSGAQETCAPNEGLGLLPSFLSSLLLLLPFPPPAPLPFLCSLCIRLEKAFWAVEVNEGDAELPSASGMLGHRQSSLGAGL